MASVTTYARVTRRMKRKDGKSKYLISSKKSTSTVYNTATKTRTTTHTYSRTINEK